MPIGKYHHKPLSLEARRKITKANRKRVSFYDELLAKKLGMEKIDWKKLRAYKRKSAII